MVGPELLNPETKRPAFRADGRRSSKRIRFELIFVRNVEINRPAAGSDKSQQVEEFTGENSSGAKSQRLPGCHPAVFLL
ncbi:hypothetical protein RP20_CCG027548 [Aedes albopictus]|nr:hypothetical protein RP20_CCG027548 [Aedes albopictus]